MSCDVNSAGNERRVKWDDCAERAGAMLWKFNDDEWSTTCQCHARTSLQVLATSAPAAAWGRNSPYTILLSWHGFHKLWVAKLYCWEFSSQHSSFAASLSADCSVIIRLNLDQNSTQYYKPWLCNAVTNDHLRSSCSIRPSSSANATVKLWWSFHCCVWTLKRFTTDRQPRQLIYRVTYSMYSMHIVYVTTVPQRYRETDGGMDIRY